MAAEGESGHGDEGVGVLEPERDPGESPDPGVGRLDERVGEPISFEPHAGYPEVQGATITVPSDASVTVTTDACDKPSSRRHSFLFCAPSAPRVRSREKPGNVRTQAGCPRTLVMFPEGGIAPTAEVEPFKTGAFVVAIQSGVPVIPVAITGSSAVLPRKGRLRLRPGTVRVELLDPIPTDGLDIDDRTDLARRARARVVEYTRRAA